MKWVLLGIGVAIIAFAVWTAINLHSLSKMQLDFGEIFDDETLGL